MDVEEFVEMAASMKQAAEQLKAAHDQVAALAAQNAVLMSNVERSRNYLCLPDFLNMSELCNWLNVSYPTLKPIVDLPGFPKIPIGVGAEFRFPKEAVREWLLRNATEPKIRKLLGRVA